jgi:hypothetical protein
MHVGSEHDTLLGEQAAERLSGVRNLGFLSAGGWFHPAAYRGDLARREDVKTTPESLEAQLAGLSHAFLDLRGSPGEAFTMSGVTHNNPSAQP